MSLMKIALCDKVGKDADRVLGQLEAIQGKITSQINAIKSFMGGISFSPKSVIDAKAANLLKNLDRMVPKTADFSQITSLIESCSSLKVDPMLKNPTATARNLTSSFKSNAMSEITSLTDSLPEFSGAKLFNSLKGSIKTSRINVDVRALQKGLTCLQSLCGLDVTSKIARLNNLLSACFLNGDGELDVESLLADCGLDLDKIENMMTCIDSIDNITDKIDEAVDAGTEYLSDLQTGIENRASDIKGQIEDFIPF